MNEPSELPFDITDIEHTADWALRVRAPDWPGLLRLAALGMGRLMVSDLAAVEPRQAMVVELEAFDRETLLVDWLSELAYLAETRLMVISEVEIHEATDTVLRATVRGDAVVNLAKHIKAVTYHELEIIETVDGWQVTVVFDV